MWGNVALRIAGLAAILSPTLKGRPLAEAVTLEKLLKLIDDKCTSSMVQDLLREAKKDDRSVLVSGPKDTVINSHLRIALEKGVIKREAVYKLLCGAEENGRQHIFFYKAKSPEVIAKYNDGNEIAKTLFGRDDWKDHHGFPQFHLEPKGAEWSDFRVEPRPNGTEAWTAKLYSGVYRQRFIREEPYGSHGLIAHVFEPSLSREVYVLRWHPQGLLEVRVPRDSSSRQIIEFVGQVWEVVSDAVDPTDFEHLDLHKVCMWLIKNSENDTTYVLGNARMMDEETGSAEFKPPHGEASLDSSPSRKNAVRLYNECHELGVHWLSKGEDGPKNKLKTIIGKIKPHEVLIAGKATSEGVDYVTHRLLQAHEQATAAK